MSFAPFDPGSRPPPLYPLAALALLTASCAPWSAQQPAGRPDLPQIGLVRGAHASSLALNPPYLSGPQFGLRLERGVLFGWMGGEAARAGSVRVTIEEDGAAGFGPLGPVAMDFFPDEDRTVVEGQWNGRRVHIVYAAQSLHGTVADNALLPPGEASAGRAPDLEPAPADSSCEYALDDVTADGALEGTSICSGMPQRTSLFVPRAGAALFRRSDLLTLLVAVLSAPPLPASELRGPRFDVVETVEGRE